jgi:hypothetical protein
MSKKFLEKAIKEKRKGAGMFINPSSNYMDKVVQATNNIEGILYYKVKEMGERARMGKLLSVLVEKLEANDFTFSNSKDGKIVYLGINLGQEKKDLRLDPENNYIMSNEVESLLRNSIEISCKGKLESINQYMEEQMKEEIFPGIPLGMLIEEELLKDV